MSIQDLKQAAVDVLAKAFGGADVPAHVVQAAVTILHMSAEK